MDSFFLQPATINILSLTLLAGVVIVMLVINSYAFFSSGDKVLGYYNVYLVVTLTYVGWNLGKLLYTGSLTALSTYNLSDEFSTAVVGTAYLHFFGHAFGLPSSKKVFRYLWYATLAAMYFQLFFLLIVIIGGYSAGEISSMFWLCYLVFISAASLAILVYAIILKQKSTFQKIVTGGAVIFYILIFFANLQGTDDRQEFKATVNIFFVALAIEHIFFAAASASRINTVYSESEKLKINNYKYQLETEQITGFFTSTIHQHDNTGDMLWDVAKNLIGKLGFEDCMIYLWNEDRSLLLQKAGYGVKGSMQIEPNKTVYHIPRGKGIVGAAVDAAKPILINDTSKDSRYFAADDRIMLSELCVPIIQESKVIGAINTEHSERNFYTDRHLQILVSIASLLADKMDKIKSLEQSREKEMEVLRLSKDLAQSQLTTLRTQMNPHFVFNALNSVQQFILQGDITEANRYLSKFSKLQRQVLNHSDQNFISLENELEVLNLYLELEQLRFEKGFVYEIKIDDDIDPDEIKVPPMIIQPFVENSIWHGLMPRQGERWVKINFQMNGEEVLLCTITDNGIGREAASRIKKEQNTEHKSRGLLLVYDRLNILSQLYGQAFSAEVKDLVDTSGLPKGTEVQLRIYIG